VQVPVLHESEPTPMIAGAFDKARSAEPRGVVRAQTPGAGLRSTEP
jgi:hypothetical protein